MSKQIYYYIKHVDGLFELFSVIETSFGGPAVNFVKNSPFPSDLIKWAESEGWHKYPLELEDL